jgi:hypothetical protein
VGAREGREDGRTVGPEGRKVGKTVGDRVGEKVTPGGRGDKIFKMFFLIVFLEVFNLLFECFG